MFDIRGSKKFLLATEAAPRAGKLDSSFRCIAALACRRHGRQSDSCYLERSRFSCLIIAIAVVTARATKPVVFDDGDVSADPAQGRQDEIGQMAHAVFSSKTI